MDAVVDIRGLQRNEAREILGKRLAEVEPCTEVLCIADGEESPHPWRGLKVNGDGVTWRPLVVEPDRVLMTLRRGPCLGPADLSVLAFMIADHRRILTLIESLADAAEHGRRGKASMFVHLVTGLLRRHLEIEESLLMPILFVRHGQQRGPASVLRDDHIRVASDLDDLAEIVETAPDLRSLAAKARGFGDFLKGHTELEEEIVYKLADRHLDEEERASLLDFCRAMA